MMNIKKSFFSFFFFCSTTRKISIIQGLTIVLPVTPDMAWQLSPSLSCWLWGVRLIKINFHIDTSQTWTLFFSFLFLSYCPYILFIKRLSIVSITISAQAMWNRRESAAFVSPLTLPWLRHISECESHWSIWWKEVRHWLTKHHVLLW